MRMSWKLLLLGLVLILAAFCLIAQFLGSEAFGWALLIGLVGASLGLLFLPKKGPQYAYRNWYRLQALLIILLLAPIMVGTFFLLANMHLSETGITIALAIFILAIAASALAYGNLMGPPTRRKGWLRRHYPKVAQAIRRYQRKVDALELYIPVLTIEKRCYFLISYHAAGNAERLNGMLLINESGEVVRDMELVRKAAQCKHLALVTISYPAHQARARDLERTQQAIDGLKEVFALIEKESERFRKVGPNAERDWQKVSGVRKACLSIMQASIATMMLEAEWASKHGLGKLTEVQYEEVSRLEKLIIEAHQAAVKSIPQLVEAGQAARRLAKLMKQEKGWKKAGKLEEGLLGIADIGEGVKGQEKYTYAVLGAEQWRAWEERTAWAAQVEAGQQEAEA